MLAALLSGCASSYKIPMTKEFYDAKNEVNLGTFMAQAEMDARMPVSNSGAAVGMQFGIIGALIGSAIDNSANNDNLNNKESQIAPLRDGLIDFDFNNLYHVSAAESVKSLDWLNLQKVSKVDDFKKLTFDNEQYFLKLDSSYALTRSFDSLEFFTYATLFKIEKNGSKKKKNKNKETVLFRNLYKYVSPMIPDQVKSKEETELAIAETEEWYQAQIKRIEGWSKANKKSKTRSLNREKKKRLSSANSPYSWGEKNNAMAKYWAKDDAKMIKSYMSEALSEVGKMLAMDMPDFKSADEHKKDKSIPLHIKGQQKIHSEGERVILRSVSGMSGQLCSIKADMDARRCVIIH